MTGSIEPSLDDIRFETTGFEPRGEPVPGQQRVWHSPEGDGVGVIIGLNPPDLPEAATVAELRAAYQGNDVRTVELAVVPAAGRLAIRQIAAVPQAPAGFTYVASLTLPWPEFFVVVKAQCAEQGVTGLKETVLLSRGGPITRATAAGEPTLPPGWDPDDPAHDAEFPLHPVARARRILAHLERTLALHPRLAELPPFPLPTS